MLQNAQELGIDLSEVETVVLTHHHFDHTGGLVTLRRHFGDTNPRAIARVHVGEGMFLPRHIDPDALAKLPVTPPAELLVSALEMKSQYEDALQRGADGSWSTTGPPNSRPACG